MNASEFFQAGRLREALSAALEAVKTDPGDVGLRGLLCELLCFSGDLERVDKQLDTVTKLDPQLVAVMSRWRQLLRGEMARKDFFSQGRIPEFLTLPGPELQLRLQASILIREKNLSQAAELLDQAESLRPRIGGKSDGTEFDDFRDLDDLTSSVFEVLTVDGKYYWVAFDQIEKITFHPFQRPIDLLWRRADLIAKVGPDATVFVPVLYPGSTEASEEKVQLGRVTEWRGGEGEPVRGLGQRMILVGENAVPILELKQLQFRTVSPA